MCFSASPGASLFCSFSCTWELRVQKWLFGLSELAFYDTLVAHLSAVRFGLPVVALFYLFGIAASVFHLTNGLVTFSLSWGFVASRVAQRRLHVAATVLGVLLFSLGAATVLSLSTGTTFSSPSLSRSPLPASAASAPCP